jgi:hypothetical protein
MLGTLRERIYLEGLRHLHQLVIRKTFVLSDDGFAERRLNFVALTEVVVERLKRRYSRITSEHGPAHRSIYQRQPGSHFLHGQDGREHDYLKRMFLVQIN